MYMAEHQTALEWIRESKLFPENRLLAIHATFQTPSGIRHVYVVDVAEIQQLAADTENELEISVRHTFLFIVRNTVTNYWYISKDFARPREAFMDAKALADVLDAKQVIE